MRTWNLILTSLVLLTSVSLPKAEAKNVLETETNQAKSIFLVSTNDNQLITKQPNLIGLNDTYWGPNQDFQIRMPGYIKTNEPRELTSWSNITQTAYMIVHRDLRVEIPYLSAEKIREVLNSMRGVVTTTGKIVRSTNLEINGYPGLELLVQHSDGKTGQYQGFIVKGRMYVMGAVVNQGELKTEAVNFFNSFRVYPKRVR